ncbi:iron-sulfur cluster repair di-iron protein [Natronolimnobius baerhuensis]|uniref:Iron-sulfur cluster repair di-iron protein n=1 Tax=Natronolimnobius baerhuensis TaxID=253108 RepID=A0A202E6S1_9EURY|nr:iron-sulfur cluster repair di-iron protein [Natronolimnobius baerhuensis]OVE83966.1 iron-sulfur cluster repair di-iron protein [Natronolimnobius baerhuensis]
MAHSTHDIDPDNSLGELVAAHSAYSRVFETLELDYCCGGGKSLERACEENDYDLESVQDRLASAQADGAVESDWETLTQLANLIVWEHHRYLRQELPALEELVQKVANVHGDREPALRTVESEFTALAADLEAHIAGEEQRAFPLIKKLDDGVELTAEERETLRDELEGFEDDHDETGDRLERLKTLTDGYAIPDDACTSYRAMLERLAELERNTHMHVHRENNVLFPDAEALLDDQAERV